MRQGWDGGDIEGLTLSGAGLVTPPFSLEVRATGSGVLKEAVAATNFTVAARAQSICFKASK